MKRPQVEKKQPEDQPDEDRRNHEPHNPTGDDGQDRQRGAGYFARTMQGIGLAEAYGMKVGCIATFTPWSAARWREVFDFFLEERFNFGCISSQAAQSACFCEVCEWGFGF